MAMAMGDSSQAMYLGTGHSVEVNRSVEAALACLQWPSSETAGMVPTAAATGHLVPGLQIHVHAHAASGPGLAVAASAPALAVGAYKEKALVVPARIGARRARLAA